MKRLALLVALLSFGAHAGQVPNPANLTGTITPGDALVSQDGKQNVVSNGAPAALYLPTAATLKAVQLTLLGVPLPWRGAGYTVALQGYYAVGDIPQSIYVLSTSACSLNSGAGDGGTQIASSTAGYCWLLGAKTAYDVRNFGATGSAQSATASGSATVLNVNTVADFAPAQLIRATQSGTLATFGTPTALTVTPSVTGSTRWCYRIAPFSKLEGIGVALAETCTTTGTAALGSAKDLSAPAQFNTYSFTPPGSNLPDGWVIYGRSTGVEAALATIDNTQTSFQDYGHNHTMASWIPPAPLAIAQRQRAATSITAVNATNLTITISPALTVSPSNVTITHDDTTAFTNAIASGLPISVGRGTYNLTSGFTIATNGQNLIGAGVGAAQITPYGCFDPITLNADDVTVAQLRFNMGNEACGKWMASTGASAALVHDIRIVNPYNTWEGTQYSRFTLQRIRVTGDERGQYGIHAYNLCAASPAICSLTQVLNLDDVQFTASYNIVCLHIDGTVASTFLKTTVPCLSDPNTELVIDNAINSLQGGPNFFESYDFAANACAGRCVTVGGGATQVYFFRPYWQGFKGNSAPLLYADASISGLYVYGGDFFTSDNGGMELHGRLIDINDAHIWNNSATTAGAFSDIIIAADASAVSVLGGHNFPLNDTTNATTSFSGVNIASGATHVKVTGGNWNGSSGCGVANNSTAANDVVIDGIRGRPISTFSNVNGARTLSVSTTFAKMYKGAWGAGPAVFCRSGVTTGTGATTDTTDTAANILANNPSYSAGTPFSFIYSSSVPVVMTLAGGTGVTMTSGTNTIAAAAGNGNITRQEFSCVVNTDGTTITCTGAPA